MSSESNIHLSNRPLEARVDALGEAYGYTIALISEAPEPADRMRFTLFVKDDRLLEMSLLFHKIAQDLAALIPDKAGPSCELCGKPAPWEGLTHPECMKREQYGP